MPARRKLRSLVGNPAGSMMAAATRRQAQRRSIVPQFCGISGSKSASVKRAGEASVDRVIRVSAKSSLLEASSLAVDIADRKKPVLHSFRQDLLNDPTSPETI